jgi:hypothetical protein
LQVGKLTNAILLMIVTSVIERATANTAGHSFATPLGTLQLTPKINSVAVAVNARDLHGH